MIFSTDNEKVMLLADFGALYVGLRDTVVFQSSFIAFIDTILAEFFPMTS